MNVVAICIHPTKYLRLRFENVRRNLILPLNLLCLDGDGFPAVRHTRRQDGQPQLTLRLSRTRQAYQRYRY
jgi:hypothetical protein